MKDDLEAMQTEMFPTKVICVKDLRSKGNQIMKNGDSYFTKGRRYNVYVDNRVEVLSSSLQSMMQGSDTS